MDKWLDQARLLGEYYVGATKESGETLAKWTWHLAFPQQRRYARISPMFNEPSMRTELQSFHEPSMFIEPLVETKM